MDESDIRRELARLIQTKTSVTPQGGDTLAALNMDSLSLAELTVEIEKHFQIRVDETVLEVETFDELAKYIWSRMPPGASGS